MLQLSRQELWTDKKTMDEILKLDPVFAKFYGVLNQLREDVFEMHIDEVKLFNQVLYLMTRIRNESHNSDLNRNDIGRYIEEIWKDLPQWEYSGELTMTMVYSMLKLTKKDEQHEIRPFTNEIKARLEREDNPFWGSFGIEVRKMQKNGMKIAYTFEPCPEADATPLNNDERTKEIIVQQEKTPKSQPEKLVEKDNSESIKQNNIVIKEIKDNRSVDLVQLHKIIDESFVKKIHNKYDWFALWRVLSDFDLLRDPTMTTFEKQMGKWYPSTHKSCSADSIGDYYKGYLGSHRFEEWNLQDFERYRSGKQSTRGYEQIRSLCFELRKELSRGNFLR